MNQADTIQMDAEKLLAMRARLDELTVQQVEQAWRQWVLLFLLLLLLPPFALTGALVALAAPVVAIGPALVSGPVMSTLVDATGLLSYLNTARLGFRL